MTDYPRLAGRLEGHIQAIAAAHGAECPEFNAAACATCRAIETALTEVTAEPAVDLDVPPRPDGYFANSGCRWPHG